MKKLVMHIALLAGILIGGSVFSNAVLLNWHPLSYYYTLKGAGISAAFCLGETLLLLYPVNCLVKAVEKDLRVFNDKEEP